MVLRWSSAEVRLLWLYWKFFHLKKKLCGDGKVFFINFALFLWTFLRKLLQFNFHSRNSKNKLYLHKGLSDPWISTACSWSLFFYFGWPSPLPFSANPGSTQRSRSEVTCWQLVSVNLIENMGLNLLDNPEIKVYLNWRRTLFVTSKTLNATIKSFSHRHACTKHTVVKWFEIPVFTPLHNYAKILLVTTMLRLKEPRIGWQTSIHVTQPLRTFFFPGENKCNSETK